MLFEDASQRREEDLDPNSQEANATSFRCFNVLTRTTVRRVLEPRIRLNYRRKHIHTGLGRMFISPGPSFSCLADGKNGCK